MGTPGNGLNRDAGDKARGLASATCWRMRSAAARTSAALTRFKATPPSDLCTRLRREDLTSSRWSFGANGSGPRPDQLELALKTIGRLAARLATVG